jgi:hypothetical protein
VVARSLPEAIMMSSTHKITARSAAMTISGISIFLLVFLFFKTVLSVKSVIKVLQQHYIPKACSVMSILKVAPNALSVCFRMLLC